MKRRELLGIVLMSVLGTASGGAQGGGSAIRTVDQPIADRYIVVLASQNDPDVISREVEVTHNAQVHQVYRHALRGFAAKMTRNVAEALAADPRVSYVEQDGIMHAIATQPNPPSWGLDRIDQRNLPLDASYTSDTYTTPVYVHVLDTGIRPTHVDFGGRASVASDHVGDGRNGIDCNGHGTHVAGTIAGTTYGVAKSATILARRVFGCFGTGPTSAVIAGVDAVTADPRRPAVANMSLGGSPNTAMDDAVRNSIAAGVTYVIAAGNDNSDASLRSPARVEEAITVGATTITDARAAFSNYGPLLDVFAPGTNITSAWFTFDTAKMTLTGTSMAAPHVAGVAAMYLQANGDRTPLVVRNAIVAGATAGVVTSPGPGSPNLLLYSRFIVSELIDPAMTSPTPGGTLTGSSQLFEWDAGTGVTGYWLYVGSSPGGADIYNHDTGTALSASVTGIPTDGRPLHVRLWWLRGEWQFADFQYTAHTGGGGGGDPQITTPTPGSTLTGSSQLFEWSAGTGASRYWLYLGSSAGGSDIYNQDQGTALTVTVTGIPTDGRAIHARLWWVGAGSWQSADFQYTAHTGGGVVNPQITMPTPGSTLTGSTQLFQWSAGTDVTRYWLSVGSTVGGTDIYNQDRGTALNANVTGIPTDGRPIHVRLWYFRGAWFSIDFQFTAAGGLAP